MTSLHTLLLERIARAGPISLAEYMGDCLMHPTLGYYSQCDPFGASGDFTTSPEISQMFGELIGLALAQAWIDQGRPNPCALVELGPGRGTLMVDAIRATKGVAGFHDAMQVHLVETSPKLRAIQASQLPSATWHDTIESLPDQPLFVIANEFFDALPIRQFVRDGTGWRERMVGSREGKLQLGLSAPAPLAMLEHRLHDTKDGDLIEYCPALPSICNILGTRINTHSGAALIIDYGDWQSLGDTLQALKKHKKTNPLDTPGDADLTAHVDFAAIAAFCGPAKHTRLTAQGVFLERLGITPRAQQLAQTLADQALDSHISAHRRLTHPTQMGDLFKVIGLYPANANPPPGLEP